MGTTRGQDGEETWDRCETHSELPGGNRKRKENPGVTLALSLLHPPLGGVSVCGHFHTLCLAALSLLHLPFPPPPLFRPLTYIFSPHHVPRRKTASCPSPPSRQHLFRYPGQWDTNGGGGVSLVNLEEEEEWRVQETRERTARQAF